MNYFSTRQDRLISDAIARHDAGDLQSAESLYRDVLKLDPACASARHRLGVIAYQTGKVKAALKLIDSAAVLEPENPIFHMSLGALLRQQGRLAEAEAYCRKAVDLDSVNVDAANNLANVLRDLGRTDEAVAELRRALDLAPGHPLASLNLANILRGQGDLLDAEKALDEIAVNVKESPAFQYEKGQQLLEADEPERAETAFNRALGGAPGTPAYLNGLGLARREQGDVAGALTLYESAIQVDPEYVEARWNRAVAQLLQGNFKAGLADWDWRRLQNAFIERAFPQPLWTGQRPRRGKLLVHAEQGVGDELLYAGLIPQLLVKTSDMVVECDARLVKLYRRSWPGLEIVAKVDPIDPACLVQEISARAGIADLVKLLPPEGPQGHLTTGYLMPDPDKVSTFRERLKSYGDGPFIGISWKSGAGKTGARKSVPLAAWEKILTIPGAVFVNLQYGKTEKEIALATETFGAKIATDLELDRFNDLDGLAALMPAMDAVVTTSNVTANLAGAVGAPTYMLIDRAPFWYWGDSGPTVPFFPSIRAYRQGRDRDWSSAISDLAADLSNALTAKAKAV